MSDHVSKWTLVVASNNESVLKNTLFRSPDIGSRCQVLIKQGFATAGSAYNSGLSEATSEVVVLAHQDVYFPHGWKGNLDRALQWLAIHDPHWGVLGVFGSTLGAKSAHVGHCYSTGLRRVVGGPFTNPIHAQTLDELVLIVRLGSGLRFDERLPGFHLYGTDICLQACVEGMSCYVVPAFCVHNSNGLKYLPLAYWRSYFYMRKKWWAMLPIATCCSLISQSMKPSVAQIISDARRWILGGRPVGVRCKDVVSMYNALVAARGVQDTQPLSIEEYV